MSSRDIPKPIASPNPLQFNSIRKSRKGVPLKSAMDGGLFLPPLAKSSHATPRDEYEGWSIEFGSSVTVSECVCVCMCVCARACV